MPNYQFLACVNWFTDGVFDVRFAKKTGKVSENITVSAKAPGPRRQSSTNQLILLLLFLWHGPCLLSVQNSP